MKVIEDINRNRKNIKSPEGALGYMGVGFNRREANFDTCEEANQYRNHN